MLCFSRGKLLYAAAYRRCAVGSRFAYEAHQRLLAKFPLKAVGASALFRMNRSLELFNQSFVTQTDTLPSITSAGVSIWSGIIEHSIRRSRCAKRLAPARRPARMGQEGPPRLIKSAGAGRANVRASIVRQKSTRPMNFSNLGSVHRIIIILIRKMSSF
jgi:hypothetical protein